jgi:hypothetical protein
LHWGLGGVILITLATFILAALLFRRRPFHQTWPACLLLLYVIYPEPDPRVALAVALLAITALILFLTLNGNRQFLPGRSTHVIAILLIGVSFTILYYFTLAPDILPADSGEFQLVATKLGVAHPPGFPLYTMLAHLMTLLPIEGTAAYKVNLLSVITSVSTLILVYLSVVQLTGSIPAGIIACLALGGATTFWAQATTANIRSLTGFFTALALYSLLKVTGYRISSVSREKSVNRAQEAISQKPSGKSAVLFLALFFLAISLGVTHHGSLAFIAAIFFVFLLLVQPNRLAPRRWPVILLAAVVGLVSLVYLPVRGAAGAFGAPGDLTSVGGFLDHVLARGFQGDLLYFDDLGILWERLKVMGNVYAFQFPPALLAAMLIGLATMIWRHRSLALLVGGSIAIFTFVAAIYRAPQTVEYLLPAYVLAVVSIGYLAGLAGQSKLAGQEEQTSQAAKANNLIQRYLAPTLMAWLIVAALGQFVDRYPSYSILHRDTTARGYAQPLLEQAPEGSTILADWHWVTPLWYLQEVEGLRPDVEVQFVFPTSEPYAETWARQIGEGLVQGRPVIATHFNEAAYTKLPQPEPIEEAFLFSETPRTTLPERFQPSSYFVDNSIEVTGVKIDKSSIEAGREVVVTVAWQAVESFQPPQNLFLHLAASDGLVYAQQDLPAVPKAEGLTMTQFRLTPRLDTPPGPYQLLLGTYTPGESEGERPGTVALGEIDVSLATTSPFTSNETYRAQVNDPAKILIGYDWDNTIAGQPRLYLHWKQGQNYETEVIDGENPLLPALFGPWGLEDESPWIELDRSSHYIPFGQGIVWTGDPIPNDQALIAGEQIELVQHLTTSRPVLRDQIVSLRLVGYEEDSFLWNWWDLDDGVPATGAIPTLKWIAGSQVRDPIWPRISDDAWPGQLVEPLLRLYDAFTGRPLPILDERINQSTPWVPLGKSEVGG